MGKINSIISVGIMMSTLVEKELYLFYHAVFHELFTVGKFTEIVFSEYSSRAIILSRMRSLRDQ
jgi:hypothetical protein